MVVKLAYRLFDGSATDKTAAVILDQQQASPASLPAAPEFKATATLMLSRTYCCCMQGACDCGAVLAADKQASTRLCMS
jgi:hypothetical protein